MKNEFNKLKGNIFILFSKSLKTVNLSHISSMQNSTQVMTLHLHVHKKHNIVELNISEWQNKK